MLFSGLTFLYGFLPAVLALYFPAPKKLKNGVLLLASLFFYAWGEPRLAWLMLVTIGVFYLCGLAIGRAKSGKAKKAWLIAAATAGVGLVLPMMAVIQVR